MANSYERSLGDGSNRLFSVPFPYISKTHVHVFIDNVEDSTFTWINDGMIQTTGTPANGVSVARQRITPTTPLVNFEDGSTLSETDLDTSALQTLYVTEESADNSADTMKPDADGLYDAHNKRVKNAADAVDAQDLVTKHQLDAVVVSAGNVPAPGSGNVGKFLSALTSTTWGWVSVTLSAATEAAMGLIQIASQAEANAGTDDTKAITALKMTTAVPALVTAGVNAIFSAAKAVTGLWTFTNVKNVEQTITDGATLTWDVSLGNVGKVTIAGNRTLASPTNLQTGGFYVLRVIQDSTGSRTVSWNVIFDFGSNGTPTLTTTAFKSDSFTFYYNGAKLLCVGAAKGLA